MRENARVVIAARNMERFFEEQGVETMTFVEYRQHNNVPYNYSMIRRLFGSWGRMENIMRNLRRNKPLEEQGVGTNVDEVLAARLADEKASAEVKADAAGTGAEDTKAADAKPAESTIKPVTTAVVKK